MAKKLTKKELKAIEEEKRKEHAKKITLRRHFIDALHGWWADVDATLRYCKINNVEDKLNGSSYNPSLSKEEKKRLFDRYDTLKELINYDEDREWDAVYTINKTDKAYNEGEDYCILEKPLDGETLFIDDTIWDQKQFDRTLELAKKLGYTKAVYISSSTSAMENVVRFIKADCKIIGTNAKLSRSFGGDKLYVDREGIIVEFPEENNE